jgi:HEAT repeat protein/beta-lactamase regulating signal transducer with metallopeptidase domain
MLSSIASDYAGLASSGSMLMLLAKATLILIAAIALTVTMQRASAGARHLVWLVTLSTLLIVPALAAWSPLRLEILPPTPTAVEESLREATRSSAANLANDMPTGPATSYTTADSTPTQPFASMSALSIGLIVWGAISLLLIGWLAISALSVRRIVRNANPLDTEDWLVPLWEIADRLELENPPRLLASSEAKMPFACGFITPTIILPAECHSWSTDRRSAVLLHEFAHVKRRDLAGHTLGRIACAFYWFHPLVWTAAKQLRNESERACDDLAISCGAKPSDYAEHLLDIVTSVKGDATPAVAMAMARRREFEGRMLAILDPDLRHSGPSRRQSAALIASLAAIAIVVGAAAPAPRASDIVVKSSVPVAVGTPEPDREFTPNDVATPGKKDETRKSAPQSAEKTQTSTSTTLETQRSQQMRTQTREFATGDDETKVDVDADTRADARIESIAARALAQLNAGSQGKQAKTDDRPVLLANILRTEKDPALRKIAAWGLSEYAETSVAADALAQALRSDSDASVREMAAWAMSDCRESSTPVKALTDALRSDSNVQVRSIAAWSLGNIGARGAVGPLTAALSDANKSVRARAAWAIGNIQPREAPAPLIALLKDQNPVMRQLAAWALYQIEDANAAPALNAALRAETNTELRIDYIRALAAIGENSVDAIRELLTSSDPKIKTMAIRALAGGQGAGPWPWPWPEPRPGYCSFYRGRRVGI